MPTGKTRLLPVLCSFLLACYARMDTEGRDDGTAETGEEESSGGQVATEGGGFSGEGDDGPSCTLGTEGCGCYESECFGDLVCASDLCVDLPGTGGETTAGDADGGDETSTTTDAMPTDDTGPTGDTGVQPGGGAMYAPCVQTAQCMPGLFCQTFFDPVSGQVNDGYCSSYPCADPIADCDPSPGDTTSPICLWNPNPGLWECALDCSQGPCPQGMSCYAYPTVSICG